MNSLSRWLLSIVVLLVVFGVAVLASAQVIESRRVAEGSYSFLKRQLVNLTIGIVGFVIISKVDYHLWRRYAVLIFILALVLMGLVLVPSWGVGVRGAQRWVQIGNFSFQPSEFAKLGVVVYFAAWLTSKKEKLGNFQKGFIPFLVFYFILAVLFLLQPDLGTFVIISALGLGMFFLAGADFKYVALFIILGTVALLIMITQAPYRMERVRAFLNPNQNLEGRSYQLHQSLLALGSGGVTGKGYGQSMQKKLGYLPAPMTDSVFCILGEELGFIGGLSYIIMLCAFIFVGLRIASRAPDLFGRLLASGVTMWIAIQAFVNIGAISGILPLTGLPLPFVSYGGSSLIALLLGCGVMLNISKLADRQAN